MSVLLQLTDAVKSYGDQMLLDEASVTLYENVKVGFVGRNGAGKSTLLRVLLGDEELDSGRVSRSPNLRVGYLRQHDPFQADESAMDFLMRDSGQPDWKCGEVAAEFELKGEYLNGPVKRLSSISRFGSCSSKAASFTRVCQPPDSRFTGPVRYSPFNSNSAATSPHFQSG